MQNFANCFKWLQKVILTSHHTSNARLPNGLNHIIHASNIDGAIRREKSIAQVADFTSSYVTWNQIIAGISMPAIWVMVRNLFNYFVRISRDNAVCVEVSSGTASTSSEDLDTRFWITKSKILAKFTVHCPSVWNKSDWVRRVCEGEYQSVRRDCRLRAKKLLFIHYAIVLTAN